MQANTMTSKSGGCGCGSATSNGGSGKNCGCGGKGCSVCEAPPEAYSRPQFFSGQLLTEDDLQSLADYMVGKNRLHNRMLFGEGVACGLRVSVDECEPKRHLVVRSGYAIDCCGNDIVVPCETRLDVVQLVRDLRVRMLGKDCGDPCRDPEEYDCPDVRPENAAPAAKPGSSHSAPEPFMKVVSGDLLPANLAGAARKTRLGYCLYLVYCEQPSDPVAPYDGEESCGGGECRPTRVREGYRFELRCGTPSGCEPRRVEPGRGFFATATIKAAGIYTRIWEANRDWTALKRTLAVDALEAVLFEFANEADLQTEQLVHELRTLQINVAGRTRFNYIASRLLVGLLGKLDCDGLQPDCPPCEDEGVLIACFDFEECTISNLCGHRRLQILSPAYFAQLGLAHEWRCLLMRACCDKGRMQIVPKGLRVSAALAWRAKPGYAPFAVSLEQEAYLAMAAAGKKPEDPALAELDAFIKARLERIDDPSQPEYRYTLLPELIQEFSARFGWREFEAEIGQLREEFGKLKRELTAAKRKASKKASGARGTK